MSIFVPLFWLAGTPFHATALCLSAGEGRMEPPALSGGCEKVDTGVETHAEFYRESVQVLSEA